MNYYIEDAKKFLEVAEKEFEQEKTTGDLIKIKQAAEKDWNATVQATNGLFAKRGESIPKTNRERRQGLKKIAPELRDRFEAKAHSLHSECFYHGVCPLELIEENIKKVREYISQIEKK